MSLQQLEELAGKHMVEFYREYGYKREDPKYRDALLRFLKRPKLPIDDVLSCVRTHENPADAWTEILSICRRSAPAAPWDRLPSVDLSRDIAAAHDWLDTQLQRLSSATGICLTLDTLNMRLGRNVGIGLTSECDPTKDSDKWLRAKFTGGDVHLIRGLYELHQEYSRSDWGVRNEAIAQGNAYSFADYILFLGYSGIILGHAFKRLHVSRTLLSIWGFFGGDRFLLCRKSPDSFTFLCSAPNA